MNVHERAPALSLSLAVLAIGAAACGTEAPQKPDFCVSGSIQTGKGVEHAVYKIASDQGIDPDKLDNATGASRNANRDKTGPLVVNDPVTACFKDMNDGTGRFTTVTVKIGEDSHLLKTYPAPTPATT